jgi:hypothetical protein
MPRTFTIQWEPLEATLPPSAYAEFSTQNNRPVNAFDKDVDESVILEGIVPPEFAGTGTLKLRLLAMGNTTTTSHKARLQAVTEFRTPDAAESGNTDAFDGTPDAATMTFSGTAYSVQSLAITLTPATTPAAGDKFRIKVTRDADHSTDDDLPVDLLVIGYELYEET